MGGGEEAEKKGGAEVCVCGERNKGEGERRRKRGGGAEVGGERYIKSFTTIVRGSESTLRQF